jgi:hypothetical protein
MGNFPKFYGLQYTLKSNHIAVYLLMNNNPNGIANVKNQMFSIFRVIHQCRKPL